MNYEVSLSNKKSIFIDEENYQKLLDNISANFVILNGEVVNPSFITSITKDNSFHDSPSPREMKESEILKKRRLECKICDTKGVIIKENKEGQETAYVCECQNLKNAEIKKITEGLVDKFKIK